MKKACLVSLFIVTSATTLFAKAGPLSRGGLGLVFPDANSFANPSRFATMTGFAVEGKWRHFQNAGDNEVTPSVVLGNGKLGLGVYGQRSGALNDVNQSTDSVGAGAGVALIKEKLLFGIAFERSIDAAPDSDGVLTGTFSLIPKGKGLSLVAGGSTTFNADREIRTASLGIGYQFNPMVSFEITGKMNALDYIEDISGTAGLIVQGRILYFGGLYTFNKLTEVHSAEGRLGVVMGNAVDISGYGQKTFTTGSAINYGATARVRF